jgi:hypothetical protein
MAQTAESRPSTTSASPGAASELDARYGRSPRTRIRSRVLVIGAAIAFVVVFAVWVVWAGLDGTTSSVEVRDTGYVLSDSSATVRFEVSMDPGTAATCAVQALDESFEIIGWKIVDIPASTERTRGFVETVRTLIRPNTGLIYRCWLA